MTATARHRVLPALAAVALVACSSGDGSRSGGNDAVSAGGATVVVGADVYTVDPNRPWADAFAYDDEGVIVAVGDEDDVRAAAGEGAKVVDADGALVLPGFQDPHVHVPEAGLNLDVCVLDDGLTLDEYADLIADCAAEDPDSPWVRAAGASLFDLRDGDVSPRDVLDEVVPDRPAIVLDDLGHAVWTNSAGLDAAGIGEDDPDPQGGVLHRDRAGRLSGLLLEDAQQLVRNAAAPDADTVYAGLLAALDELAANGVTTMSDAGGYWQQGHDDVWDRAVEDGTFTVRAFNSLYVYPSMDPDEQLAAFEERFRTGDDQLRFDTAKVYVDGILDLGTASLLDPYDPPIDPAYPNGFEYFTPALLQTYVDGLIDAGYRIEFHVIGDRAARRALDALEAAPGGPDAVAERRHRTTHTYLVDGVDVPRFHDLGVVADFQVNANAVDPAYLDLLSENIGDRAYDLIPIAELLAAGGPVSLSSDWDAGDLPPLGTIERSLTRAEHAVPDVETAISLVTLDAAYALGHDDRTGSIEVGKLADFIVLDTNILDVEPDEIDEAAVLRTVVGGREVYSAP